MSGKNSIKLVIFDFDGCIANVEKAIKEGSQELILKYVKTNIDVEKIARNEGMAVLIKKSGISYWKVYKIVRKFRKIISKTIISATPYNGIPKLLSDLNKNYTVGIVTSNSKKNVNKFLKKFKLTPNFHFVKTNISLFTKAWWLWILIKKHGFKRNETVIVGDEVRDIEAANKVGVKSIAVTWGLNTKKLLKHSNPDHIVDKPSDILKIINQM